MRKISLTHTHIQTQTQVPCLTTLLVSNITRRMSLINDKCLINGIPLRGMDGIIFFLLRNNPARPRLPHCWLFLVTKIRQTHTHTHTVGFLRTRDHSIAGAATYTKNKVHSRRTYMTSDGFEPAIPAIKRSKSYALDRAATAISFVEWYWLGRMKYSKTFPVRLCPK